MTFQDYPSQEPRASVGVSRRELRTLARRLAPSERPELRAVARCLDKAAASEAYSRRHHDDGPDYDPFRCAACVPDLWVVYAIGVALPNLNAADVDHALAGLHGLSAEDLALALDSARDEQAPPDLRHGMLVMSDRHHCELGELRAELKPGFWWCDDWGRWWGSGTLMLREREVADLLGAHARESAAYLRAHGVGRPGREVLRADPALLQEIRFGNDPRKARALRRAALRKGFDPSWLI